MVRHEAPILYDFDPRLAKRVRCLFIADSGLHPHVPWTSPQYLRYMHRHIAASAEQLDHIHRFIELINQHGGDAELLMLPDAGLVGSTHIPFADMNNVEVADLLSEYLAVKGLDAYPN